MATAAAPRKALTQAAVRRMRKEMPRGARIKFARKRANLTLDGLAALAGTSRQHLIRLEKGLHNPTPELAARISEHTDVPVELIRDEEDEEEPQLLNLDDFLRARVAALVREVTR